MTNEVELFKGRLPALTFGQIQETLLRLESVPTLPLIVERIFTLTADAEAQVQELASVIAQDQAITARLLKVSNSAFYAPRQEVRTIAHSIMMLGFREVKALCVAMKVVGAFPKFGEELSISMDAFWRHSLAAGLIARLLSHRARPGDAQRGEELFFAGLLHDFGKIVIHQCFPKHFLIVSALALRGASPFSDLETKLLGVDHAWCGHFVAQNWKIPRMIAAVMAGHHNVPPASLAGAEWAYETAVAHVADALAHRLEGSRHQPAVSPHAWGHLPKGLEAGAADLWGEAGRIREHLDTFFKSA